MGEFTTGDGVTLHYRDSGGTGSRWSCCTGGARPRRCSAPARTGPDRRVITVDLRGHGVSDKPHHGYRIARFARDAQELLDHLGMTQVDVLGWSMGVSVWWSFIDQYGTDRMRRFVAVDQPAAVAAVPWMVRRSRRRPARSSTWPRLLALGAGAERSRRRPRSGWASCAACSRGDTDPELLAFVDAGDRRRPRRTRGSRCCWTTAPRTGATCSPASTCPRWCSAATAAT